MQTEDQIEDQIVILADKLASLASSIDLLKGEFDQRPSVYDLIEQAANKAGAAAVFLRRARKAV